LILGQDGDASNPAALGQIGYGPGSRPSMMIDEMKTTIVYGEPRFE